MSDEDRVGKKAKSSFPVVESQCESESRIRLCDPMDCRPLGSSARGILLARILEWVAMPFSRGFPTQRSDPGIEPTSSALQVDSLPFELPRTPLESQWNIHQAPAHLKIRGNTGGGAGGIKRQKEVPLRI